MSQVSEPPPLNHPSDLSLFLPPAWATVGSCRINDELRRARFLSGITEAEGQFWVVFFFLFHQITNSPPRSPSLNIFSFLFFSKHLFCFGNLLVFLDSRSFTPRLLNWIKIELTLLKEKPPPRRMGVGGGSYRQAGSGSLWKFAFHKDISLDLSCLWWDIL